jgi:hypothetical protein
LPLALLGVAVSTSGLVELHASPLTKAVYDGAGILAAASQT